MQYLYSAYSLVIASDIHLPELSSTHNRTAGRAVDVTIRLGDVPTALGEPFCRTPYYTIDSTECLLELTTPADARFLVRNGNEIIVQPVPGYRAERMHLFLLGSCMGALLHQRGALPLHGSTVAAGKRSFTFVGASGNGKSTTAAACVQRGGALLADDVSVVHMTHAHAYTAHGIPRLKLWGDAARQLGCEQQLDGRVQPAVDKHFLPVHLSHTKQPLDTIYILQPSAIERVEFQLLRGIEKVQALLPHIYRYEFAVDLGRQHDLFNQIVQLTQRVRVVRIRRPRRGFSVDEIVERVFSEAPQHSAENIALAQATARHIT